MSAAHHLFNQLRLTSASVYPESRSPTGTALKGAGFSHFWLYYRMMHSS
jgi:hypothetical protein